jgi:hypothetical protein
MHNDQTMWTLVAVLMFLFFCHCGLLLYFSRYLKTRGVADLSFSQIVMMAVTGDIKHFYKYFYAEHSKEHGRAKTKALIILQISSVVLIIVLPVLLALFV